MSSNKTHLLGLKSLFGAVIVTGAMLMLGSCGETSSSEGGGTVISGSGKFVSSTLASSGVQLSRLSLTEPVQVSGNSLVITPSNVSGKSIALIYTFGEYCGIDIYGPLRPDLIQPTDSDLELVSFDLSQQLVSSTGNVRIQDGCSWGETDNMAIVVGYFDVTFTLANTNLTSSQNVVRFVLGDIPDTDMQRGDVLLKFGSEFKYLQQGTDTFTTTRPSNPVNIDRITNFLDPIRPNMHYYALGIQMVQAITVSPNAFTSLPSVSNAAIALTGDSEDDEEDDSATVLDATMVSVVDFNVASFLVLDGVSSAAAVTGDAHLIRAIDLLTNDSLTVSTSVTITQN